MSIMQYMNDRVKRFSIWDIKLAQFAAMCVMLIIVKLVPEIMTISVWWFVVLAVISAIKPLYVMYLKKVKE
ncbi:MAG: hypothetical protein A2Y62_20455 [Candidatus Fischerbacteria bacterium RBG_13_37_8]|uniref:Uncharacterized protein n=1 Tax=Candidatus Fischerbacteria bacterium RBG_13_37_8 TaxID=1817863 RepID=A0A1F5VX39_9BACT|nr:MAG: hypothetical protein A2Y62_20455 [Candidatus Fischerbacteria bacterium RBG_13_37_8]